MSYHSTSTIAADDFDDEKLILREEDDTFPPVPTAESLFGRIAADIS